MNRRFLAFLPALLLLMGLTIVPGQASAAGEPTELLRYHGDGSSATGAALGGSEQCDVNGDEFDDAVVGAWFWDKAPINNIGAAYVLLGSAEATGGSLNNPAERNAVRIDGPSTASAFVGFAVGCLGDVNGDGFDDVGISHYTAQKAYVVFGAKDFSAVDLGLLGSRGYEVKGDPDTGGNVGYSLAPVGDLDDDGFDDFGVAEVVADTQGRTNNGRVWVIAGQDDVADVDLTDSATGQVLMTVDGAYAEERLGSISAVGDVNGDETDDFVVGSYTSTPWGSSVAVPGSAAVIFGGAGGEVDLASLGNRGFRIFGPTRGRDRLGISVSPAGDVNGDGLEDLLIGGDGVFNAATGIRHGSAWVVFGSSSTATVYTAATANDSIEPGAADVNVFTCDNDPGTGSCLAPADQHARGYWINGTTANDSTGYSVTGIGDVNADGTPDFAIGAYGFDPVNPASPPATMSGAGAVFVVYGKTDTDPQLLAGLTPAEGYRIDGLVAGDRFGRQVGRLGDFDGNGAKDLFAGGDFAPRPLAPGTPLSQAGEVVVALMGPLNTRTELSTSSPPSLPGGEIDLEAAVTTLAAGGHGLEQGTVTFTNRGQAIAGCAAVPVVGGSASCDGVDGPRGGYELVAEFASAEADRKDSASNAVEFEINDSTTATIESSVNPVLVGKPVTFTAKVEPDNGGDPVDSGTIIFEAAGEPIEDCDSIEPVDGVATCEFVPVDAGTVKIAASYSGGDSLGESSAELDQTVSPPLVSTTGLTKFPTGPVPIGSEVRLRALVHVESSLAPSGKVTFTLDGEVIPACADIAVDEADGTAECAAEVPSRGSHAFGSSYESDTISITGSESAPIDHEGTDASETSISISTAELETGEGLTVDSVVAAVSGGASVNEGRIRVLVDGRCGSDCDTKPVVDGKARHELTFSRPGTFEVSAEFSHGQFLGASSSVPVTVTVAKAAKPERPVCPRVSVTVRRGQFSPSRRTFVLRLRATRRASVRVAPRIEFKRRGRARTIRLKSRSIQLGKKLRAAKFGLTRRQAKSLPPRVRVAVVTRATTSGSDCVTAVGPSRTARFRQIKTGA